MNIQGYTKYQIYPWIYQIKNKLSHIYRKSTKLQYRLLIKHSLLKLSSFGNMIILNLFTLQTKLQFFLIHWIGITIHWIGTLYLLASILRYNYIKSNSYNTHDLPTFKLTNITVFFNINCTTDYALYLILTVFIAFILFHIKIRLKVIHF